AQARVSRIHMSSMLDARAERGRVILRCVPADAVSGASASERPAVRRVVCMQRVNVYAARCMTSSAAIRGGKSLLLLGDDAPRGGPGPGAGWLQGAAARVG